MHDLKKKPLKQQGKVKSTFHFKMKKVINGNSNEGVGNTRLTNNLYLGCL